MRALWKGSISFGLVNVPISLYPATNTKELTFHLLRRKDLSPVKYKRVAEADGKEVPWNEIVKGYEFEKDKFVTLTPEDFRQADVKASQTIEVIEFVRLQEIDPIYFDKPYYLEPQKAGAKAYALLRDALKQKEMVGIAKVVLKTRQHLASLKPRENTLVLELMHFWEELVRPNSLQIPNATSIGNREMQMASELIDQLSNHWKPDKYTDDYRHALLDLIEKKAASGGRSPVGHRTTSPQATKVIDLVSVLQESLKRAGKNAAGPKTSQKDRSKRSMKKAA